MASPLQAEKQNMGVLDQVILGIAHELNNPNAFVRLSATNLKKMLWMLRPCLDAYEKSHPAERFGPYTLEQLRAKINQQVESILDATVRIIVIADKLKQCTSDSLEQFTVVSMLDVLRDMVEAHRFLLDRCTTLEISFDEQGSYAVEGYRLQLEQAVSVLLTNACDAIQERYGDEALEKGRIQLSLEHRPGLVVLRCADNGCGMGPATLEKAFVPYFTTKPQGMGDGLGLPISRSIATRHGGNLRLESEEGEGTTVVMELPRKGA